MISDGSVIFDGSDGRVISDGSDGSRKPPDVLVAGAVVVVVVVMEGLPPWLPVNSATMPQVIRAMRIARTALTTPRACDTKGEARLV